MITKSTFDLVANQVRSDFQVFLPKMICYKNYIQREAINVLFSYLLSICGNAKECKEYTVSAI